MVPGAGFIGKHKLRRGAPQAFEVVIAPRLFAENVQDETTKIDQCPFGGGASFTMFRRSMKLLLELLFDLAADGLHLGRAESRADDEIVREGTDTAEIENGDSCCFFILRRFDGDTDALWQRV